MRILRPLPLLFLIAMTTSLSAQQAQQLSHGSWTDLGSGANQNSNDSTAGNGPTLGKGVGAGGEYMTWTYQGEQYRVLKSACSEAQWNVWLALNGHHVEITMTNGVVTDIHDDV